MPNGQESGSASRARHQSMELPSVVAGGQVSLLQTFSTRLLGIWLYDKSMELPSVVAGGARVSFTATLL